ncbi:NAD-P-binding protein [Epithele typhae]|uniref:NAD-P-binding protein n=1 Tax=Epithele typhae TaxID=378194 RepID=UPI0020078321|nr:NAD-P-binding protein [Epithele typhae]KAH9914373.1 NAD-P-binding protein [Epithele typhae]
MSSPSRVWFITGTSSGFGLEMARCALGHGDRVVATLRNPSTLSTLSAQYPAAQLLVTRVDVTHPKEIKAAFALALDTFGRVDVVFNNAGYVLAGEAEGTPDADARALFEVDFWGAVYVSQEALRVFRDVNVPRGGRLIQNSAAVGLVAFPNMGFYGAAKHALEGFSETLSMEVHPDWNIKITCVEPGAFGSTGIQHKLQLVPQHPAYSDPSLTVSIVRRSFAEGVNDGDAAARFGHSDAVKGVARIYELSKLDDPPMHLPLGLDSVAFLSEYAEGVRKDVEEYASWSDDLEKRNSL